MATVEEECWSPRIDESLSPRADHDPQRRLHNAIRSLNRNQRVLLIRFMADANGRVR